MPEQRFRVGLPNVPQNSIIGSIDPGNAPPYALTASEVATILSANSIVQIAANTTFSVNLNQMLLSVNSVSNTTIALPDSAPEGSVINVLKKGTGNVTFTGTNLRSSSNTFAITVQWAMATAFVESVSSNTALWVVVGT